MEPLLSFEKNIQGLADKELVEQTRLLFKREKRIGDAILLGLKEIKARRIYSALGYASLFEMLVKYFHLSESSSYQRLNAIKLMETVPTAQESIFKGEVSVSNAALVQSFIQRSEKETPLSLREKQEIIEGIKGKSHKEAQALLAAKNPSACLPHNREKPLSATHTQLQLTLDQRTLELLKEARDLLSHRLPSGDLSEVIKCTSEIAILELKKKKGRTPPKNEAPEPRSEKENPAEETRRKNLTTDKNPEAVENRGDEKDPAVARSRYISQETKRIVFARAHGQCEFVGADGQRCGSTFQTEIDHIQAWSQGGGNEAENLSLKCRSHNFYRTKETHGFLFSHHPERIP